MRRERALAKRRGIKPPPSPIIPPVAGRPAWLSEIRIREYTEALAQHENQHEQRMVTFDEWVHAAEQQFA